MREVILLMTRPAVASQAFVDQLDVDDVTVIHSPLIKIVPNRECELPGAISDVIFTSSNGVHLAPDGEGRMAYCIGARTARLAKERGWKIALTAQDADALVVALIDRKPNAPLLHLAGEHRRGEIAERLSAAGIPTQVQVLYTQPLLPLTEEAKTALAGEATVIVPLFSARTAAQFRMQAPDAPNVQILAMSAAVADALKCAFKTRVLVAKAPTGEEMRRGVENLIRDNRLP